MSVSTDMLACRNVLLTQVLVVFNAHNNTHSICSCVKAMLTFYMTGRLVLFLDEALASVSKGCSALILISTIVFSFTVMAPHRQYAWMHIPCCVCKVSNSSATCTDANWCHRH